MITIMIIIMIIIIIMIMIIIIIIIIIIMIIIMIIIIMIFTSSLAFKFGPQIEMEIRVSQNHFLIDMKPDSESPRVW